jgi:hypothetical protein
VEKKSSSKCYFRIYNIFHPQFMDKMNLKNYSSFKNLHTTVSVPDGHGQNSGIQ